MGMTENRLSALLILGGYLLAATGLATIYLPFGLIALGAGFTLLGIDGRRRP